MKTVSLKFAGCAALLALGLNAVAGVAKIGDKEYDTLAAAIGEATAGQTVEIIVSGDYALPGINKEITVKAAQDVAVNVPLKAVSGGSMGSFNGVTFEGMTFTVDKNVDYTGINLGADQRVSFVNCTFYRRLTTYGSMICTGCTFNQDGADYCITAYGPYDKEHELKFTNCTFNNTNKGKFLNLYNQNRKTYDVTIEGCTFDNKGTESKAAILIKEIAPNNVFGRFNVYIKGTNTLKGLFPTGIYETEVTAAGGNGLWANEGANPPTEDVTVYVNGLEVYPHEEKREIEIEKVEANTEKGITQDVADEINNNTAAKEIVKSGVNDALANIDPAGAAVVKVELEKVEKATDEAQTPTLTFEVAPYVGDTKVENVNQKLNGKKVTVVLPLTSAFTVSAIVTHAGDPDRLLPVLGGNNPYVQFETTHFSAFGATPSNQKVSSTTADAKTVLGIKRVKQMDKSVDTAAAVPWVGAAGGNCKVSELITTGLAMGDTIKVYDLATKGYFTWVVNTDGKWVKVNGAPASQPEAHEYTLARGRAFWYMKDGGNESVEYTQIGTYSTDQILTATDKGGASAPVHNLLINPKWADFNVSKSLVDGAKDGDQIVIVDSKLRYQFKVVEGVGKWGTIQPTTKTVMIGGQTRTVRGPDQFVPVTEDLVILAGNAFWYISKGGEPTVKW